MSLLPDLTDPFHRERMQALATLHLVMDPEIGINIVDLGLVYEIMMNKNSIEVKMTLSTPNCPMGESIMFGVRNALEKEFPDKEIMVDLTFEPPWTHERISAEGRQQLGLA